MTIKNKQQEEKQPETSLNKKKYIRKETAREILHWINKQNMKWVGMRETAELILLLQELEGEIK